jgi:hypothetical protein
VNLFMNVLETAHKKNWCVRTFCTTCGSSDFRGALKDLVGNDGRQLVESLASLELRDLLKYPFWRATIRLALGEIHSPKQMDEVLLAWLQQIEHFPRVADLVLFYFVRRGTVFAPMSFEVLTAWTDQCVKIALKSNDESLLESLVYTLGSNLSEYPNLESTIISKSSKSSKIKCALQKCGLE